MIGQIFVKAYGHHVLSNGETPPYWVEATQAPRNPARIDGYAVFCKTAEMGKVCLQRFTIRGNGTDVALHLANAMRDDLNAGIE